MRARRGRARDKAGLFGRAAAQDVQHFGTTLMWICADCKLERAKPLSRPPMGWKKRGATIYCAACWRKLYACCGARDSRRKSAVVLMETVSAPSFARSGSSSPTASNWMMSGDVRARRPLARQGQADRRCRRSIFIREARAMFPEDAVADNCFARKQHRKEVSGQAI